MFLHRPLRPVGTKSPAGAGPRYRATRWPEETGRQEQPIASRHSFSFILSPVHGRETPLACGQQRLTQPLARGPPAPPVQEQVKTKDRSFVSVCPGANRADCCHFSDPPEF